LFSIDRFSASIADLGACPSEVYYTDFRRVFNPRLDWKSGGSLFASDADLGLQCTVDNLDALDIRKFPRFRSLSRIPGRLRRSDCSFLPARAGGERDASDGGDQAIGRPGTRADRSLCCRSCGSQADPLAAAEGPWSRPVPHTMRYC
jgi:hypothetical protein